MTTSNILLGGLAVLVVGAAMVFVVWRASNSGGRHAKVGASRSPGKRANKKVSVVAPDGTEHPSSLSLDGLDQVSHVREALAELAAEVLDDDDLLAEDLFVELRDELGRRRTMVDDMAMSAILRAASLRVRRRKPPRPGGGFD